MPIASPATVQAEPKRRLNITHAYLLALSLIACAMFASYWLLTYKVTSNIDKATVINKAGMQRMLSQRLGLLASEIDASDTPQLTQRLIEKFSHALDTFNANHKFLVDLLNDRSTSQQIRDIYAGPDGVDTRSLQFILLADDFLASATTHSSYGLSEDLSAQLIAIARNGFLEELDAVVQQYDQESTDAVNDFVRLELLILCVGLILLLFEALFIFQPIVKTARLRERQLEKSNRELMEFSFRISHDLRSPVASCRGLIEIAQEAVEDKDSEMVSDVVGRMDKALLRLETLIEDIIVVTRNNVSEAETEYVDMRKLVTDTLDELSAMQGFTDFQFNVDIESEQKLLTKKLYLQQVLQNLLSNAIKYANNSTGLSPSEDSPQVTVSSHKVGKTYELTVTDNGQGIPESCHGKVFGMFNRFHPDISQGSGLGLYLTKQNALALGGDLHYEPLPSGSRFRLIFTSE